jgi:hypothetical protein
VSIDTLESSNGGVVLVRSPGGATLYLDTEETESVLRDLLRLSNARERMAKALYAASGERMLWEQMPPYIHEDYLEMADVAIEAIT